MKAVALKEVRAGNTILVGNETRQVFRIEVIGESVVLGTTDARGHDRKTEIRCSSERINFYEHSDLEELPWSVPVVMNVVQKYYIRVSATTKEQALAMAKSVDIDTLECVDEDTIDVEYGEPYAEPLEAKKPAKRRSKKVQP